VKMPLPLMAYNGVHENIITEPTRGHIGAQGREGQGPKGDGQIITGEAYRKSEGSGSSEVGEMTATSYGKFLRAKRLVTQPSGFAIGAERINRKLFEFQRDIVRWGVRKGKCAFFEDCGLGKTAQQLEWAHQVSGQTGLPVIIFAPLAVSQQTKREGEKFEIPVNVCRAQSESDAGINITNYEMLEHFDPAAFGGVVLDESSILKGDGPMRKAITEFARENPYRLACTATPAPNDHMELGNHAEFLGLMSKTEMLSTFFVHDGGDTSKWRLKGHAERDFWRWVASWAVMIRRPSDLGYEDGGFELPPIEYHQHTVAAEWSADYLFPVEAQSLSERQQARRDSLGARVKLCAELVNGSAEQWLLWCNLNDESNALASAIPDAVEVTGSDSEKHKESAALAFVDRTARVLVSKPSIFGFGMNFQNCRNAAFVGLSDSWEQVYQATRRVWRFGQSQTVHTHFITGELEGAVVRNIQRKETQAAEMAESMVAHMKEINTAEIHGTVRQSEEYRPTKEVRIPSWLQ
jgi:hypothetical protein